MSPEEMIFDKSPERDAAKAISRGDAGALVALIERGLDVNAEGRETRTPWGRDAMTLLLWATLADSPKGVELLLAAGADADKATRAGLTPLIMASGLKTGAAFDLLVRHRADPNIVYPAARQSALLVALTEPSLGGERWRRAGLLVARGAILDLDLGGGDTALTSLAQREIWDAVLWLLDHGADVEARNDAGMTMPCYLRNSFRAATLLASVDATDRERVRTLLLARGIARSRLDPALHPGPECDD